MIFLLSTVYSQQSKFDYVEGEVTIKRISGDFFEAEIDDVLNVGDSVITGSDGYAELSLESSSSITIDKDTVFLFSKKEKKGEKKSIFMVVLGKIKFKFDRLLHEPDIETPASVAGIRGTEFTVVSALDGSALYVVDEGSVAVESEGTLVVLNMEEGVEIPIGDVPGEKFDFNIDPIDFSGWLDEGNRKFDENPAETLASITGKLISFADEADRYYGQWEKSFEELTELRTRMVEIEKEKGAEAKGDFYKNDVFPKEISTSYLVLNYRYFAISALSLRRYVISSMYIDMKTKYILDSNNPVYVDFLQEYETFLKIFEENVVDYLDERDI